MIRPKLSLVIPAFNEAHRLDSEAFKQFVRGSTDVNLLFVDDGSTDATLAHLTELAEACPGRISVSHRSENAGKAEAVRHGLLLAAGDEASFVGFADADLATPLEEVLALLAVLEARPDAWVALGSRVRLLGRQIERSAVRHYLGRVFATLASMALRLPVYDTQCGMKLFRNTPEVRSILEEPFMSRWIFDVELLARLASHAGPTGEGRFREVPLERWRDRSGSRLRWRDFGVAPLELLAIRRRYGPTR